MLYSKEYRFLDVGGTFIKCSDGRLIPVPSNGSKDAISLALKEAIGPLYGLKGVGVAIPGPFNYSDGIFLMKHKFQSVYGLSFRDLSGLREEIELKFHHDVNALLLGAIRQLGLEKGNTAVVTLGTGLGFAYALEGKIRYNEMGSPARSLWNIPLCDGGILEDRVSARGILSAYNNMTGDNSQSVLSIAERAFKGEEAASKVFQDLGEELGAALKGIIDELGIETLLLGGQISKSMSLFEGPLRDRLSGISILPVPEGAVFEGLSTLFKNK